MFYRFILIVLLFLEFSFASDNCYEGNCGVLLGNNHYLTSATSLKSDYDLDIAKKILACKCLEGDPRAIKEVGHKDFFVRLRQMVNDYQMSKQAPKKDRNNYKLIEQQKTHADSIEDARLDSLDSAQDARRLEAEKARTIEAQKKVELAAQQKAQEDSSAKADLLAEKSELLKEIEVLVKKRGTTEECFSKCQDFSNQFGEEPDICKNAVYKKVKSLLPSQIKSRDVADIYFSPQTDFPEWYMNGKNYGYVQVQGRVAWVSNGLAEIELGSNFVYLIKFSGFVVRERLPIYGYGKPVGDVTFNTVAGGSRTLPCLKIVWLLSNY